MATKLVVKDAGDKFRGGVRFRDIVAEQTELDGRAIDESVVGGDLKLSVSDDRYDDIKAGDLIEVEIRRVERPPQ